MTKLNWRDITGNMDLNQRSRKVLCDVRDGTILARVEKRCGWWDAIIREELHTRKIGSYLTAEDAKVAVNSWANFQNEHIIIDEPHIVLPMYEKALRNIIVKGNEEAKDIARRALEDPATYEKTLTKEPAEHES